MSKRSSQADRGRRRAVPEGWRRIRRRIYERDGGRCVECGIEVEPTGWQCGHKIDRSQGGSDEDENLAVMCQKCNAYKPRHATQAAYDQWHEGKGRLRAIYAQGGI